MKKFVGMRGSQQERDLEFIPEDKREQIRSQLQSIRDEKASGKVHNRFEVLYNDAKLRKARTIAMQAQKETLEEEYYKLMFEVDEGATDTR